MKYDGWLDFKTRFKRCVFMNEISVLYLMKKISMKCDLLYILSKKKTKLTLICFLTIKQNVLYTCIFILSYTKHKTFYFCLFLAPPAPSPETSPSSPSSNNNNAILLISLASLFFWYLSKERSRQEEDWVFYRTFYQQELLNLS